MIEHFRLIELINSFRSYCLGLYPDDVDPLPAKEREERLGPVNVESHEIAKLLDYDIRLEPINSIVELLKKSPRLFKMSLRRTLHAWLILHGETDFDDILVQNVLRFTTPEAYDFLLEYTSDIRNLESRTIDNKIENRRKQLRAKWDAAITKVNWNISACDELVYFLFPSWKERPIASGSSILQGVRNSSPTDYWKRANLEDLSNINVRDQEMLHAIKIWKSDQNAVAFRNIRFSDALYSEPDFVEKFEQFALLFLDGQEIRTIAHAVFVHIIAEKGVAGNRDITPAFTSLWRLSLDAPVDEYDHLTWILEEITRYLPISIRFANDLYYFWRHDSRSSADINKASPKLRGSIILAAKELFTNSPVSLIRTLDPNFMYSIYHFAVLYSGLREGGSGFKPSEWKWLAKVALDAAKINPQVVLPQIITWIFHTDVMAFEEESKHTFNKDWADELFGEELREVMKLISEDIINYGYFNEREQKRIMFARRTAKEWIQKNLAET